MVLLDIPLFFLLGAVLLAGIVKGAVGLGFPTTAIGLLTLTLDEPRKAIALILIPMLVSNAWQVWRSGQIRAAFWRYLPFALALMVFVGVTLRLSVNAPDRFLLGTLGVAILIFVAVNVSAYAPRLPERWDRTGQLIAGTLAGIMGGLTSVWAPPMAVYLAARQSTKEEFVRASGLLILLGSLPLTVGYIAQGHLTLPTATASTALLVPTLLGFAIGERIRHALSEVAFRRMLLFIFFLMALNLLRRAFF